jgi:hypothetical protein
MTSTPNSSQAPASAAATLAAQRHRRWPDRTVRPRAVAEWVLEQTLGRLVQALHRAGLIRAVVVTMSERAGAIWESVIEEAGGIDSTTCQGLMRLILADSDCGLVRFLVAEGADIGTLRGCLESIVPPVDTKTVHHGAIAALCRRSYEVVPVEKVAGQRDRRQTLHTIHFLWGFAADRSAAGAALRDACPFAVGLSRDSDVWATWYDAGQQGHAAGRTQAAGG